VVCAGAKAFLEYIRAKYEAMGDKLHIFYSCGPKPIMGGPVCDYIKKAVSQVRNAHYIDIQNVLDIPQDLGCDNHPNVRRPHTHHRTRTRVSDLSCALTRRSRYAQVVGQQKMANAILPVVRDVMGWH
jgi:ABC-type proline/glycine betaine transport system ATPase subunit